ncbi:FAD-dependent monooxygenase [Micromonospora maris]|uniref:Monooxygenase n=1 Tax=Micromonospora maris TaxID=1003110 RepID=A0A9X0I8U1_9ACTN|nr:FAD-dependent monooxygenase [Micromonospora maris]AEB43721.1 monooxygenase FAD-binding protein [Micromonospora maris AB-18-032]KUJ49002.1 monooxygenase [Micromonospora maris]
MTAVCTALVVGGGIAGPVTAMALRRAGIEATVYEGHPSAADGAGVTLTLAPNGLAALRAVDAEQAVREVGLPMRRTVITDGRGGLIGTLPHVAVEPVTVGLWRDDLARALRERAEAQGVPIVHGKRLVDAESTTDGVLARFGDGSTATADLLIGADGIRSRVRTLIDPAAPDPQVLPLLNLGGAARYAVPDADPEAMYLVFGSRGFFGYWVEPDGRTAWFANVPDPRPTTWAEANQTPPDQWLHRLREVYADDVPAHQVLAHTDAADVVAIGSIESMPSVPHWYRDRMVLVGDAVHAPSPSSGQGASLAVESAVQLARCLRDHPDLPAALTAYERLRRPRVEKVVRRGRQTTSTKTAGPVAKRMMRIMMPLALRTFLNPERSLGAEQRYRIDWDAPVSAELAQH